MKLISVLIFLSATCFPQSSRSQTSANPTFDPTGKLVFCSCPDAKLPTTYSSELSEICVLDINKKTILRLTYNNYKDEEPCWSPDGKEVVFVSKRPFGGLLAENGPNHLFLIDIRTGVILQLDAEFAKEGFSDNSSPCWSPNGYQIAFVTHKTNRSALVIYDTTSKHLKIAAEAEYIEDISWSPNGKDMAFKEILAADRDNGFTARVENVALDESTGTKQPLPSDTSESMDIITWMDSTKILFGIYPSSIKIYDTHIKSFVPNPPTIPAGFEVVDVGPDSGTLILLGETDRPDWQKDLWLYIDATQSLQRLTDDGFLKSGCHIYRGR